MEAFTDATPLEFPDPNMIIANLYLQVIGHRKAQEAFPRPNISARVSTNPLSEKRVL